MHDVEQMENEAGLQVSNGSEQYLTFLLGGEEYGLNILNVQEIKGWDSVTPIPNTPVHVLGVINLRGTVVPIIDLRECFSLPSDDFGATTVVIVVKAKSEVHERVVGIVVDAVSEVYNIPQQSVEPPPAVGTVISIEYIKGLATVEGKMATLLNIEKMVEAEIGEDNFDDPVQH